MIAKRRKKTAVPPEIVPASCTKTATACRSPRIPGAPPSSTTTPLISCSRYSPEATSPSTRRWSSTRTLPWRTVRRREHARRRATTPRRVATRPVPGSWRRACPSESAVTRTSFPWSSRANRILPWSPFANTPPPIRAMPSRYRLPWASTDSWASAVSTTSAPNRWNCWRALPTPGAATTGGSWRPTAGRRSRRQAPMLGSACWIAPWN